MKIMFCTQRYGYGTGGIENYVRDLGAGIANDHLLTVMTTDDGGCQQYSPGTPAKRTKGPRVHRLTTSCLDSIRLLPMAIRKCPRIGPRYHTVLRQLTHSFYAGVYAPKVTDALKLDDVQIMHFFGGQDFAAVVQRQTATLGIPFAITPFTHIGWWGDDDFHLRIYRAADAVFALTHYERNFYVAHGVAPERVHVVGAWPHVTGTADAIEFRKKYNISAPMILFIGRKEPYKGYRELLAIARQMWDAFPTVTFVFIGPRTKESVVDFAACTDARIIDLGLVSEDEKASALAACDVLCLPSASEGFGLALLEAWYYAKPVLGYDTPISREVIHSGEDGVIVSPSRRGLFTALYELLCDSKTRERMGRCGYVKQQKWYSLTVAMQQTLEVYTRLQYAV